MIVLDKIKAFLERYTKWYAEGMEHLGPKSEAKGTEKKAAEPPKAKVEAPEKKGDESSSK